MTVKIKSPPPVVTKGSDGNLYQNGKLAASVSNMTTEHRAALDSYLLADHPMAKIVDIVMLDWGEFKGSTKEAVRKALYRYKSGHITPKQVKIAAKHSSSRGLQRLTAQLIDLEARLDPVLELEHLVIVQHGRVKKMSELEEKAPTLLDAQTKNISLMGELLNKLIVAQLDTGVLKRVPRSLQVAAVDISNEEREFMERARISDKTAGFLVDAMRILKQQGVVDVVSRVVSDAERTQGS